MTDISVGFDVDDRDARRALARIEDGFDDVRRSAQGLERAADLDFNFGREVAQLDALEDGFDDAKRAADDLDTGGGGFGALAGGLDGLIGRFGSLIGPAAIGGAVVGLGALVQSGAGAARELNQLERISGLSASQLQTFGRAARDGGGSAEDVADAVREMQLRLAEAASLGTGPAVDALNLLGVSLEDISALDTPERFALIRDRISEVEDPAQRLFLAEELLGGSAERLNSLLAIQSGELDTLRGATDAEIDAAERAQAAFDDVTDSLQDIAIAIAADLVPLLEQIPPLVRGIREELDFWTLGLVDTSRSLGELSDEEHLARQATELLRQELEAGTITGREFHDGQERIARQLADGGFARAAARMEIAHITEELDVAAEASVELADVGIPAIDDWGAAITRNAGIGIDALGNAAAAWAHYQDVVTLGAQPDFAALQHRQAEIAARGAVSARTGVSRTGGRGGASGGSEAGRERSERSERERALRDELRFLQGQQRRFGSDERGDDAADARRFGADIARVFEQLVDEGFVEGFERIELAQRIGDQTADLLERAAERVQPAEAGEPGVLEPAAERAVLPMLATHVAQPITRSVSDLVRTLPRAIVDEEIAAMETGGFDRAAPIGSASAVTINVSVVNEGSVISQQQFDTAVVEAISAAVRRGDLHAIA